jgi:putative molybdopterin biosynthesis protein
MQTYLNTEEAAAYLGIKERKLYELVATNAVPCSKVTGKWLFPRLALDRWIEAGMAQPRGMALADPPPIIGGSHDPLLEWAVRHSGASLALLNEGSGRGLENLNRREVTMAAIHFHAVTADVSANSAALLAASHLQDGVLVAFARREQGLLVAGGNPLNIAVMADAVRQKARFGLRQGGAGAQMLLEKLLALAGASLGDVQASQGVFATGQDMAFALRAGDIDCGIATRAVAQSNDLGFVPQVWEEFDLAMHRRSYFLPGPQKLFALMRTPEFRRHAERLGGYDTGCSGIIRLNR